MELEVFTTNVELQDIPSYTTNITVEGQLLKLSFMWNERIGKRTLHITDSADQCYLQNTILHPNEPFELNANAVLNDLPYSVTLIKTGDQKRVGNIFNWSKDFILCFSRTVDVEVEKLNVVYGVTNPSTPTIPPIVRPPDDDTSNVKLFYNSYYIDWENEQIELWVIVPEATDTQPFVTVTLPNLSTIDIPLNGEFIAIPCVEGIYKIEADWENIIGDVYLKASNVNNAPPKPIITSVNRDANNLVRIEGTSQTFTVIAVFEDGGDGTEMAFVPVNNGDTNFVFELELPENFSGYLRCRDGGYGSSGASFTI